MSFASARRKPVTADPAGPGAGREAREKGGSPADPCWYLPLPAGMAQMCRKVAETSCTHALPPFSVFHHHCSHLTPTQTQGIVSQGLRQSRCFPAPGPLLTPVLPSDCLPWPPQDCPVPRCPPPSLPSKCTVSPLPLACGGSSKSSKEMEPLGPLPEPQPAPNWESDFSCHLPTAVQRGHTQPHRSHKG